jgi:hypothetical protein
MGNNPKTSILVEMSTPALIRTVLTNHPKAIECLKQEGIFQIFGENEINKEKEEEEVVLE